MNADPRPIALLTDFGLDDPYVGQVKGTLARLAPESRILDLSHGVAPFQIGQAAFFLAASAAHFPDNTVFMSVVDPGVGSKRRIVAARIRNRLFLAPDNGLLGLLLCPRALLGREADIFSMRDIPDNASATFHGRDIFAPLAARLAKGEPLEKLGIPIRKDSLVPHPATTPRPLTPEDRGSKITAHVLHVDRFDNVILNLQPGELFAKLIGSGQHQGVPAYPRAVRTYSDLREREVGMLEGSQGLLELAVNQGSAAKLMGCQVGHTVTLTLG
ncbi:SAM hydrolase/SAM-dependent halogenase family protein [Paucidesulfovibrio longus]|uniref:SAM hydrolase/SAM-dependent halogenase family protein n=1 Tax=Paucidesulfovibrio longus TaxID=889 RepID=UPI0003B6ECEE|nr:SAM-dependent chlorinase/fluorinase [Paucidesulfovibrio longus]